MLSCSQETLKKLFSKNIFTKNIYFGLIHTTHTKIV